MERKGRTRARRGRRLAAGFEQPELDAHLAAGTIFEDFFAAARLHPDATAVAGTVCGIRVEQVEDPLVRRTRYLDELVEELAGSRPVAKVLPA